MQPDSQRAITLYVDGYFVNQWDATCMVALEEKQLAYSTSRALLREGGMALGLVERTGIARVPALQHGDFWLTESLAIVEYLEETFPPPSYPRLLPDDPRARARTRQAMMFARTSGGDLRNERPWWTCVYPAGPLPPLSRNAERDVRELSDFVVHLSETGELAAWSVAHVDLALSLFRAVRAGEVLPPAARELVDRTLARGSVRRYLEHARPPNPPPRGLAAG
ncbi:MAG TPA: glutathione S-transferase N-terminal domain-containing protein [Kofleriaceae bacterium]|nr:glutathione S-transferase N-terminal domain-containing protein [Kofleriaceae bacterium]